MKISLKSFVTDIFKEPAETMEKIKIAIVEDEMINAETLHDMLEELGYEVCGKYMRAEKAWEAFQKEQPDFALLDIRLKGEKTGIWLAEQIKKHYNFPYIYLTSFGDKKTIEEAAKTSPFGYLMKPIEKQNLHASIEVALHKYADFHDSESTTEAEEKNIVIKDALFVKDEYYYTKLPFKDILYAKSSGNYIEIHTENKKYLIKGTLGTFAESLPSKMFFQTHRSHIINLEKADGFGANFVKLGKHEVPVSKNLKDDLLNVFQTYSHVSGDLK